MSDQVDTVGTGPCRRVLAAIVAMGLCVVAFVAGAPLAAAAGGPVVTQAPADAYVSPDRTATFTAAATGSPTPAVQWQKAAPGTDTWVNIAGATGTTSTVGPVTTAASGTRYRAVFANMAGAVITNPATLTVS